MNHGLGRALSILCLLAGSPALADDTCEGCALRDRGDRMEGVYRQPVAGGAFELRSLHYQRPRTAEVQATPRGGKLHLVFWLPAAAVLDEVKVWQPERLYRMEPARKEYGEGRQSFLWPYDEVVGRLGLAVDALYTSIQADEVYYPALVATHENPSTAEGYEFVFHSGGGIDAMCSVVDEHAAVRRTFECWADFGGTIVIEWDGRDDLGRAVPAGVYTLKLKGDMLTETMRPLDESFSFWHRGGVE